jgi:OFA family oxalate/formate antiporter-like MFS transporter
VRPATAAIAAATFLNLPFGTLYAFSVFLKPMESLLSVGRAEMTFVFALATITLTGGMLIGPWFFRRAPSSLVAAGCGIVSSSGLFLAAGATAFVQFALGYGVLFGLGAGVGYIVMQQGVNQAVSRARGLANGYSVSLYPLGAMLGAPLFGVSIEALGLRATLASLGAVVLGACLLAGLLHHLAAIRMHDESPAAAAAAHDPQWPVFWRLFAVFFLAAAAGLMVLSQAAGIVQAYGGATALALGATTFITGMIGAARIAGGWLTDRFAVPHVAIGAHACSLAGAIVLTLWPGPLVAVPALALIGMGYGFVSGLTAAAIAQYWHRNDFGFVAGRLYISWGVAAVTLPILAGWIYDKTQGYGAAVMIAAGVNVLGVAIAAGLPSARAGR